MAVSLDQKISKVQQSIAAKQAAGKNTTGLEKKLAKLLRRVKPNRVANGLAVAAITVGVGSIVGSFLSPPSGDNSAQSASQDAGGGGSASGYGGYWGVTIADNPSTGAPASSSGSPSANAPPSGNEVGSYPSQYKAANATDSSAPDANGFAPDSSSGDGTGTGSANGSGSAGNSATFSSSASSPPKDDPLDEGSDGVIVTIEGEE